MNKRAFVVLFILTATVLVPVAYYKQAVAQIEQEVVLEFYYTASPTVEAIAQIVKSSLEAAGIKVNMHAVDFNELIATIFSGGHDLSFFGFGLGTLPTFVLAFTSYAVYARYVWYWKNDTLDSLAFKVTFFDTDWDSIVSDVHAIQEILLEEFPLIPIYQNQILSFYKNASPYIGWINLYGAGVAQYPNSWTPLKVIKYDSESKQVVYNEGNLTLPLGWEPAILNPFSSDASAYDWTILDLIYGGFYASNPYNATTYADPDNVIYTGTENITYTPANVTVAFNNDTIGVPVGEKVEGLNITIKLREGLKFSDGENVTADDVVFTYKFLWWLFEETEGDMGGFEDVFYFGAVCNVEKVDERTVLLQVGSPAVLAKYYALGVPILPEHIWGNQQTFNPDLPEKHFPDWDINGTTVTNYVPKSPSDKILVGTGPFKLYSWDGETPSESTTFVLVPNEHYFGYPYDDKGNVIHEWVNPSVEVTPYGPYIKALTFKVIKDPSALYQALINGDIDAATEFELGAYVTDLKNRGFDMETTPRLGFGHVSINCHLTGAPAEKTTPMADLLRNKLFRKAIALAIDKEAVVEDVWYNWAIAIDSPIPPSMNVWKEFSIEDKMSEHYYEARTADAKAVLESLGLSDVDGDGIYEIGYSFLGLVLPLWAFVLVIVAIVAGIGAVVYYVVFYRRKKLVTEATTETE